MRLLGVKRVRRFVDSAKRGQILQILTILQSVNSVVTIATIL